MFFFAAPRDLFQTQILSHISLQDMTRFDTAITSRTHRIKWLNALKGLIHNSSELLRVEGAIDWLLRKKFVVKELTISNASTSFIFNISHTCKQLRSIVILSGRCEGELLTSLAYGCPNLRNIEVQCSSGDNNHALVALGESCPHLQNISLGSSTVVSDVGLLALAHGCHDLRCIVMKRDNNSMVTDTSLRAIMDHCRHLNRFSISFGNFTDNCVADFLVNFNHLVGLGISKTVTLSDNALLAIADYCRHIEILDISQSINITDNGVSALRKCVTLKSINLCACHSLTNAGILPLTSLPQLRHINISLLPLVTDAVLFSLAEACPHLSTIEMRNCPLITDAGVVRLSEFCIQLTTVNISHNSNNIQDESVVALARNCAQLTHLNIQYTFIGNISVIAISHYCKHLQVLQAFQCSVTHIGYIALVHGCPALKTVTIAYEDWEEETTQAFKYLQQRRPDVLVCDGSIEDDE